MHLLSNTVPVNSLAFIWEDSCLNRTLMFECSGCIDDIVDSCIGFW